MLQGTLASSVPVAVAVLGVGACRPAPEVGDPIAADAPRSSSWAPSGAKRIVTAALLPEDLLLGVLPEERWAGISFVVDWPSSTPSSGLFPSSIPRVNGGAESILARSPDLVLLSEYNNAATEFQLEDAGVRVERVPTPRTFESLFRLWRDLGRLVDREATAAALAEAAEARFARLARKAPPKRVLLLFGRFAYAGDSLHADCLRHVGLENVLTRDPRGTTPELSAEELATLRPNLVFLSAPVTTPRLASVDELPPELPYRMLPDTRRPAVVHFPEAWLGSLSQHALTACEAYVDLAQEGS
ncbi:MAG: ABC transporter substrate-binding protein [Deltaproteobacteria bacterium]|nr:ABC transporter substrate-binding protein [Deltaproteobacteria bacterium]